jgi:hypothetical protein
MHEEYKLNFGVHKGKPLLEVARESPSYVQWIAGMGTKFSRTEKGKDFLAVICRDNPDDVQAAKDFVRDKCCQCWQSIVAGDKHFCEGMRAKTHYHYHPYGRRT